MFVHSTRRTVRFLVAFLCCLPLPLFAQSVPPASVTPPGAAKPATPPAQMPPEVQKAAAEFDRAIRLQRAGKITEAIAGYKSFLQRAADAKIPPAATLPAYQNLAQLYQARNDAKNVEWACKQTLKLDPRNAVAYAQLSEIYVAQHRLTEAKETADKVLSLSSAPNLAAPAHFALGSYALARNENATAEKEFAQAAKLAPNNPSAHYQYGFTLAREKKYRPALVALEKARSLAKVPLAQYYIAAIKQQLDDVPGAIAAYDVVMKEMPGNVEALYNRSFLLQRLGKTPDAISGYLKLLVLRPDYFPAKINLGQAYAGINNFTAARKYYADALKQQPKNPKVLSSLGYCILQIGSRVGNLPARQKEFAQAEGYFKQALALAPNDAQTQLSLGLLYEQMGRYDDAIAIYRKRQTANPADILPYYQIARAYTSQRKVDEVVKTWKEYRQHKPDNPVSYQEAARILEAQGRFAEALAEWKLLLERRPKDGQAMVGVARALALLNRNEEARAQYKAVLPLDTSGKDTPPNEKAGVVAGAIAARLDALRGLAKLAQQEKKSDEQVDWLDQVKVMEADIAKKTDTPPNAETYLSIAKAYEDAKKPELAIREYRALAQVAPKNPTPYERLGYLYDSLDKTDEAATAFREAAKRTNDPAQYQIQIAELYRHKGKLAQAATEYETLRTDFPKDKRVYAPLAQVYEQLGQNEKALDTYEATLKNDPTATWVYGREAIVQTRLKHYDAARALYEKLLAQNPDNAQIYADISNLYKIEDKSPAFLTWLQARAEKTPANRTVLSALLDEYTRQKRADEGWAYLRDLAAKHKAERPAQEAYAALLVQQGKRKEALPIYRQIFTQNPNDQNALDALIEQLDQSGNTDEATKIYETQAARTELTPAQRNVFRRSLAARYVQTGKRDAAIAQYQEIIKAEANDVLSTATLAQLLTAANREQEAIPLYVRLAAQTNYPPVIRAQVMTRLASLYEKRGNKTDAIAEYREALKLDPNSKEATEALKRLGATQ